jgi:ribosome biogenesis GTPase
MSEAGLVVARFRRHALVQSGDGERYVCQFRGRRVHPVVGDQVLWHSDSGGTGTVVELLPRASKLTRINKRGRPEIVAANLSQLVIVLAARPAPDWFLLDRYLSAAELTRLKCIIVFNKLDLDETPPAPLGDYERLGYTVYPTSARAGTGLDALTTAMNGERSVMIGQSGVGKSSLLNVLAPDAAQAVGQLTEKGGHGRHTTTTAVLHRLAGGGELVDSPGVRDYAPYIDDARNVQFGFREFAERTARCRFDDCRHLAEPGCAIKAAVSAGEVTAARYESYKRLIALTQSLQTDRH